MKTSKRTIVIAAVIAATLLAIWSPRLASVRAEDNSPDGTNQPTWRLRPSSPGATNVPPAGTTPVPAVIPAAPTPAPATEPMPPAWAPQAAAPVTATNTVTPEVPPPAAETVEIEEPAVSADSAEPAPVPAATPQTAPVVIETPKQPVAPPPPAKQVRAQQMIPVIEFQNAPVNAVLDYYARLTGRSIISAPNLGGVINFRSQTELTLDDAIAALNTVLAQNNIGIIPMGEKFLKVVQIATAKQEGPPLAGEGEALPAADTFLTQVLPLTYAEAQEIVSAIQPYLHGYGHLMPLPKSNAILVTDTANNINKMTEIIRLIDKPSALRVQTKIYELKHAKAAEVVQRLQGIVQETAQLNARPTTVTPAGQPQVPRPGVARPGSAAAAAAAGEESAIEGKAIITADDRTNKIFIMTRPSNFAFFDQIILELDAKVEPDVQMLVVALQYGNAEEIASLLNALISGGQPATGTSRQRTTNTGTRSGSVPPPPTPVSTVTGGANLEGSGFLQFAEGVRILPDTRTNSLLLMAAKEDMDRLQELIRELDTPVSQVLVEVVIGEVNLNGTLEMGVEFLKRMFSSGSVQMTGSSVASPGSVPPVNLQSITGELLSGLGSNAAPLALSAATGGLSYFATFQKLRLDAALRLLQTSNRFKVLSEPTILTLHNKEASIVVGESRPVPTSTVADITSGSTAVRSSIEFKDIAIELKVTPIINPDGYVTMDIEQKINDFGGNVPINGVPVPIITKREAKSSVTVKDQNTIVLGGLIRENKTVSDSKVPILGDIPILGTLFRSRSTNKTRNELIVFIRPTVIRNASEAVNEARKRAAMLKGKKELDIDDKITGDDDKKPAKSAGTTAETTTN